MGIGERVRDAHLSHFCPGGAGFPVKSPNSVGLNLEDARFARQPWLTAGGHAAHADGQACGRCDQAIAPDQDVRRGVTGAWLHENCPEPASNGHP